MKRQANTLSAIIKNFDTAEEAIEASTNAMGSAEAENAKYLDSIEGRVQLFKNEVQNMWVGAIDSDFVKFIVDAGTGLVKLVEKFGLLKTAMVGLSAYIATSKKFPDIIGQANGQLTIFGRTLEQISMRYQSLSQGTTGEKTGILSNIKAGAGALFGGALGTKGIDLSGILDEDSFNKTADNIIQGFNTIQSSGEGAVKDINVSWKEYVSNMDGIDNSMKNVLNNLTPVNNAIQAGSASYQAYYSSAVQAAVANSQVGNSAATSTVKLIGMKIATKALGIAFTSLLSIGISLGVSALVSGLYKLATAEEEAAKNAQEVTANYSQKKKELEDQKKTVDELAASYQKLAPGVNTETNTNIGLTTESYQEYLDVCNQIAEIYPELVDSYDSQGNAILSLKGNIDQLIDSYKKANKEAAEEFLTDKNKKDIWKTYEKASKPITQGMTASGDYVGISAADQERILKSIKNMSGKNLSKLFENDKAGRADMWDVLREQLKKDNAYIDDTDMISAYNSITFNLDSLDEYKNSLESKFTEIQQTVAKSVSGIKEAVSANLVYDDRYQEMDSSLQGIVQSIINNIDPDMVKKSGAKSVDEFNTWFGTNIIGKLVDGNNPEILKGINSSSDAMAKAMASGDEEAFNKAKEEFNALIKDNKWLDDAGNVVVDENADAVTQYLQTLAQNIQNASKNFEVELQFKTDYKSSLEAANQGAIEEAKNIVKEYNEVVKEATDKGVDLNRTIYGNIDLNNRQVLNWTDENLNAYKDILGDYVDNVEELKGTFSTVIGKSAEFDGVEIAFSPMLQTEDGPKLLDEHTVSEYIMGLIDKAGEDWTAEDLLQLDVEGLEFNGEQIHGLIAGVGDDAKLIGEIMHYGGTEGAIADKWDQIAAAAERAGISAEEYVKAVQEGDWEKIGLDLPEDQTDKTVSELIGDQDIETYVKNAKAASESSGMLAESYHAMINSMAGDNENFDSSDFTDMYDDWLKAGKKIPEGSNWTDEQIAGLQMADEWINQYGLDIDSLKQRLIDLNLLSASLEDMDIFDLSSDSTNDAIDEFQETTDTLKEAWEKLNSKEMTKSEFIDLVQKFPELMNGVNLASEEWFSVAIENVEKLNNTTLDNFIKQLEDAKVAMEMRGMDTTEVQSMLNYLNWMKTQPISEPETVLNPTSVTDLTSAFESYQSVLENTNEIAYDGAEVTQDYKDSLVELGIAQEDVNECFDKSNPLIVKNSTLLRKLIAQKKADQQATVRMAKANAQLQYTKMVKQLGSVSKALQTKDKITGMVSEATMQNISALRSQMAELQQTIQQYGLLEVAMTNAASAYDEYEKAKERDSQLSYDESFLEALDSIDEGILSGKVGSEEFEYAVKMIVPEDVYKAKQEIGDIDGMVKAIHDYCDANPLLANWFTVDNDSGDLSITSDNIRSFIQNGIDAGAFTGTINDFKLSDGIESIEQFTAAINATAEGAGVTEGAVLAMLSAMEDCDGSWGNVLSDVQTTAIDRKINDTTKALDEAYKAQEDFIKNGGDLGSEKWQELCANIEAAKKELQEANEYAINNAKMQNANENLKNAYLNGTKFETTNEQIQISGDAKKVLEQYNLNNGTTIDTTLHFNDDGSIQLTKEQLEALQITWQWYLNHPTSTMDMQFNYDTVVSQLDTLNKVLDSGVDSLTEEERQVWISLGIDEGDEASARAKIAELTHEKESIEANFHITTTSEDQTGILEKLDSYEINGVTVDINAKTDQANADIDAMQENAETDTSSTHTINIQTNTVSTPETTGQVTNRVTAPLSAGTVTGYSGSSTYTINVQLGATYTDTIAKITALKTDSAVPIEQKVDVSDDGTTDDVTGKLDTLNEKKLDSKNVSVGLTNYYTVISQISSIKAQINNLPTSKTITINVQKNGSIGATQALGNVRVFGTANANGKQGLQRDEKNSIVGEVGEELVVDPYNGIYYTVGSNGTEMVDLPKGAIIYNHKQTRELLKNGHTSRGRLTEPLAFAEGNAHYGVVSYSPSSDNTSWKNGTAVKPWSSITNAASSLSDAASSLSSTADDIEDDTEQTIDFIEYKLENIENVITKMTSKLETFLDDTSQTSQKKDAYNELISAAQSKADTYLKAIDVYEQKANEALAEIPEEFKSLAQNGGLTISDFIGEDEGETASAIEKYREWAQKATDAEAGYYDAITEIASKCLEQLQDIADDYENVIGLKDRHSDSVQGEMDLLEESGERLSEIFYKDLIDTTNSKIKDLENERTDLKKILDEAVQSGNVKKGSDEWYEMVNAIFDVDDAITECKTDIEKFQNSINDLYWDNLDKLIDRIDNVDSELSHLYNLVSDDDKVVDEMGNWTSDGVTALGMLAQQLEVANYKVQQYGEAIEKLKKDYADGLYSTDEYNEKLAELTENQWDAIEAQEDAKKSIVDLNKVRVEAVKDGIQKEIDSYAELIDKKKEELSLQKDAKDFEDQVAEKQKEIAEIEKKLAVMSADNSASAIAQKKKLQEELYNAQKELEDLYYDHSIEKQQDALDKTQEDYENQKQDEMDALDESLKNQEQIISDSYEVIKSNTQDVFDTLTGIAQQYGIDLSDAVINPWQDGINAIGNYKDQLTTVSSSFTEQLDLIKKQMQDLQTEADKTAQNILDMTKQKEVVNTASVSNPPKTPTTTPTKPQTPSAPSVGASVTVKKTATNFSRDGGNGTRMQSWIPGSTFTVYQATGSEVLIGRNGGYTGWVKLSDIEGYAKGTKNITEDQWAILDELGDELQLVPDSSGRLSYVKKGTGIIPADLTSRLMEWGQLDPSSVLEQSKPTVSAPYITNNNMELNMSFGSLVHVDSVSQDTLPELQKMVRSEFDNCMKGLNQSLKRFTR